MKVSVLIVAWATLWVTGCGQPRDPAKTDRSVAPAFALTKEAPSTSNSIADNECQKSAAGNRNVTLNLADIYALSYDQQEAMTTVVKSSRSLTTMGITADPVISSIAVDKLLYGSTYERICQSSPLSGRAMLQNCYAETKVAPWKRTRPGTPLKICNDPAVYPRESFEAVSLTSVYYIERAYNAIAAAYGHRLPKITVEILPHYVSYYPETQDQNAKNRWNAYYFVHNLAYFPGSNLLIILPESDKGQALYEKSGHLWESAFALGHEMGHHLEHEILTLPADGFVDNESQPPLRAFLNMRLALLSSEGESRGPYMFADGLLEGFADLVGYYVSSQDQNGIKGLLGFGINRNPGDPLFHYDNETIAKKLDAPLLQRMTSATTELSQQVNDTYKIGSIIGYAMQSLINIVTAESYQPYIIADSRVANSLENLRLGLAIEWFSQIWQQPGRSGNTSGYTRDVPLSAWTGGFERMIGKQFRIDAMPAALLSRLRFSVCRETRQLVPVTPPPYLGESGTSC